MRWPPIGAPAGLSRFQKREEQAPALSGRRSGACPAVIHRLATTETLKRPYLLPVCRWTRTQRIRTAAAIPIEAVMVEQTEPPVYLRIAEKTKPLRELGMSDKAIARALEVSDKTVAKAISHVGLLGGSRITGSGRES